MKKLISILLILGIAVCAPALASGAVFEPVSGVIVSMEDNGLLIDSDERGFVFVRTNERTPITGADALEVGMYVFVEYNGIMTRSLPPQITAREIRVYRLTGTVTEVLDDRFLVNDELLGEVYARWENAAQSVAVGSPVTVYYNGVMALSLPGQVNALKVDTYELTGSVYASDGESFTLQAENGALYEIHLREDTRMDVEIAAGARVRVLYNGALTRSIPAQANALAVLNAPEAPEA